MSIRPLSDADFGWVLELSARHERETGKLDPGKLAAMRAASYKCDVVGDEGGYLITFDQDGAYDSPNFVWFKDRYPRFVYVDRIVIDPDARKAGHARTLYEHLFESARVDGHKVVGCEVNSDPPNPASDAFHGRMGFKVVGQALLGNGKTVRYMTRDL
ncbi:MAG: GNAT family N-acetyltransferase [Hyphomonadaceae bacterium]